MKTLIVAATAAEINPFLHHFNLAINDFIETESFDVLITGVGMTATAFSLGQRLSAKYNLVVNAGIAGSFDTTIQLGEVVNISKDIFAELGAENNNNFIPINDLGFGENTFQSLLPFEVKLPAVTGITVNKVHGNALSIEKVVQLFNPQVESMEGAAVLYACHQMGLQCLQVRSISNYVEPRNKENWKIGLAIKNLNDWLIEFFSYNSH